jgi:hypothetical protein
MCCVCRNQVQEGACVMAHQRAFDLEVAHVVQARLAKQLSLVLDRYSHIIYFHHQDLSELSLKMLYMRQTPLEPTLTA